MNTAKHLLSLVVFLLFIFLAVGTGEDKDKNKSTDKDKTTENKSTDTEVKEEVIDVTADKLYSDYESNGVAADQKYKDKVLRVTGKINSIDKDILDKVYVTLETSNIIGSIQCYFDSSNENIAAELKKGQKITVKGRCDGKMINVVLKDCTKE